MPVDSSTLTVSEVSCVIVFKVRIAYIALIAFGTYKYSSTAFNCSVVNEFVIVNADFGCT